MFRFARMSNAKRRRSPFESASSHLPGQSVEERIRLLRSKWEDSLALPLCLAALALYEWWRWLFSIPSNPPLLTIVAALGLLVAWRRRKSYKLELNRLGLAREDECRMGELLELLELLRERGYRKLRGLVAGVSVRTLSWVRPALILMNRRAQ